MSEPVSPEVAQSLAADQIAGMAENVGGQDQTWQGGQPAGPAPVPPAQSEQEVAQNLVAAGGKPMTADVEALQARIDALEAANKAAADAAAAKAAAEEPKAPVLEEVIGSLTGAAPGIVHALSVIAQRLDKAGL